VKDRATAVTDAAAMPRMNDLREDMVHLVASFTRATSPTQTWPDAERMIVNEVTSGQQH